MSASMMLVDLIGSPHSLTRLADVQRMLLAIRPVAPTCQHKMRQATKGKR